MEYIKATKKDTEQIVMLVQDTIRTVYPKYYPKEVVDFFCELHSRENIFKDIETGVVSILKKDNMIIGTGCHKDNHITRVYVAPTYQNQGYGSHIMECLEKEIGLKYDVVYLDASLPASHLYEKRGYKTVSHEKWNVENGVVLVYEVMEKFLHSMKKIKIATKESDELQWLYSQDWVYHDYGNCKRHLQIIFPYKREWKEDEKYPLILFIPGSAWHKQEMYNDIPQYATLAKRGFVVAAMEYRESDIAAFPAQVEDVCNALKFIPSIADNFHIDMDRIYLMGNSSGGHIAMMSVLFNAQRLCEPLPRISGVICESGSTDLLICAKAPLPPWIKTRPSAVLLGVDKIEGNEEPAKKASCAMYITEGIELPPILLIHSELDPIVSVENSRFLYEQLVAAGHSAFYYELESCDAHGGAVFYGDKVLDIIKEFVVTV